MTLRQKISWQMGAMLLGLILISAAALIGINALHQDYGTALEGYQRLRQVYVAGAHLTTAQKLLQWPSEPSLTTAHAEVRAALTELGRSTETDAHPNTTFRDVERALQEVEGSLAAMRQGNPPPTTAVERQRDVIIAQVGRIAQISSDVRQKTEEVQRTAESKRQATLTFVEVTCGLVVFLAILLAALHYRKVMDPLRRLSVGVRRLARGHFNERIDVLGDDELASLARDFNRMAEELDGFYSELERKVAEKSKELIRSERLASVGYLAAGVAHEINNPLGIISGYAELSLNQLQKVDKPAEGATHVVSADVRESLRIICDEAFRCKGITEKLLSLSRGGDDDRAPLSLLRVAREVAAIVGALREHRAKMVDIRHASDGPSLDGSPGDGSMVWATEAEMKQVLLNLVVNSLEAVQPVKGEVVLQLRTDDDVVELTVSDNGEGMSPEKLERVFEPFFTDRRSARENGRRGTGLGLSITHAIVQSHGGTISAHSGGPGKGSRFVVRLPAWRPTSDLVAEAALA